MLSIDLTTLLSIALLIYAWWPGHAGRNRWTGRLVVLCLLSPGLRYLSALFTFPIRLQLSAWAGSLLQLMGINAEAEGNLIIKTMPDGHTLEMVVDPACMGLQLTGLSLLVGLFSLIWQERVQRKNVSLGWVLTYESTVFGLTILCNLFRIVLLVVFDAMPGSLAHEGIGLACVAVYAWIPAWSLAQRVVQRIGQTEPDGLPTNALAGMLKSASWGFGILVVGISIRVLAAQPNSSPTDLCTALQSTNSTWSQYESGCHCKTLTSGFVQLAKPGVLIYLKPQLDWFSADHNPLACWRGSGYELRRVQETTFDGHPAYVGELQKKGLTLYTVWWFSNGPITTISQLIMRGTMLQGERGFVLVNITTDKPLRQCSFTEL